MPALPTYQAPEGGQLTQAMVADYRRTGVLVLEDFVSVDACRRLKQRALELVGEFDIAAQQSVFSTTGQQQLGDRYFIESGDKIRFFLEADALDASGRPRGALEDCLNKMGHAMHDLDAEFERFSHTPDLAAVARAVGLDDPVIIQSMYIFKPPKIGGEVTCHQDSTYIYTEPETCTGFWFALEDATVENGCMHFLPGEHQGPLKKRNYRVDEYRLTTDVLDDSPWPDGAELPAEAAAGTLVVFHGRAPHMSAPNRSDRSRHAYTLHAIDRTAHYPAENWLQRTAELPLRGFD